MFAIDEQHFSKIKIFENDIFLSILLLKEERKYFLTSASLAAVAQANNLPTNPSILMKTNDLAYPGG